MNGWRSVLAQSICRVLRLPVRGGGHLAELEGGGLIVATHPGGGRQWVLLAWLAVAWARLRPSGEPLLVFVHPEARLSAWLRFLLPEISFCVADPVAHREESGLTAAMTRLEQHLRAGGVAVVWPMAVPEESVTAARSHLKPYGWSLLAAQQADVPVLAGCVAPVGGRLGVTLLPARRVPPLPETDPRQRRQTAGRWAQDLLGEAALAHHLGSSTLWQMLCQSARQYGRQRLMLTDATGRQMTYGKLLAGALILGAVLAKQTRRGRYVGVLLPTSVAATTTFFALQSIGRIPALLNFTAGAGPVSSACRTARIETVYTSRLFVQKAGLSALVAALQPVCSVHYLEDVRGVLRPWHLLAGWVSAWFPEWFTRHRLAGVTPGDPAVVLFTSGSEGEPKGVVLSHDNLLANGVQLHACIHLHSQDVLLNVLPVFHAFGLTVGTLLPLWAGIRSHCLPSPLEYHLIPEVAYAVRATLLAGTDTFLAGYGRVADPGDFVWMRYVVAGAEPLREETWRLWVERFGIRILEGYGTTEASPVLAVNTPLACRFGSVGRLLPGVAYRLDPVPGIVEGALLSVQGPNMMLGYLLPEGDGQYRRPASPHGEGWYASGDVVRLDEEGFLYILGRAKRFAKIGGEMVSLAAVEQVAALAWPEHRHAAVALGAASQETGGRKGERLVLVTECPNPDRQTLLSCLRVRGLGEICLPWRVIPVQTLPVLGSGKIDFAAVQGIAVDRIHGENQGSAPFSVFSIDPGQEFL